MRAVLVRLAGLTLYVRKLQSGTLTLLHERPNRKAKSYELEAEDFEDCADDIDDGAVAWIESALETSAVGLSLYLIQNDGTLKVTLEGGQGGCVDWMFQGLEDLNEGSRMACVFTQTDSEASLCYGSVGLVPPKLSISTVQTSSVYPSSERIVRPLLSGLSTISTTETRPTEPLSRHRNSVAELKVEPSAAGKKNELKRKAAHDVERALSHKRAKSSQSSPPWPNHLYMTCFRTRPVSKSDTGTLHIDVVEGTAWFEGWYGRENTRTFEKKQIDLRCPSTSVHYVSHHGHTGVDVPTLNLHIATLSTKSSWISLFSADCSAPGWQTWGSDTDTSPGPVPTLTAKEQIKAGKASTIRDIPCPRPTWTSTNISPSVIVDALVHCVDRASRRQAIHDPDVDYRLQEDLDRYALLDAEGSLAAGDVTKWRFTDEEVKTRAALKKKFRTME